MYFGCGAELVQIVAPGGSSSTAIACTVPAIKETSKSKVVLKWNGGSKPAALVYGACANHCSSAVLVPQPATHLMRFEFQRIMCTLPTHALAAHTHLPHAATSPASSGRRTAQQLDTRGSAHHAS